MSSPSVSPVRLVFLGASTLALCVSWSFGCTRQRDGDADGDKREAPVGVDVDAVARIAGPPGTGTHGFVRFEQKNGKTKIVADLAGLPPGQHGFHIHENGSCDGPDFESAGEHYTGSPTPKHPQMGKAHGMPNTDVRHAGDMGNIVADGGGGAHIEREIEGLRSDDIIGRAVIVHESGDDGVDAKSAGGRIACGIIEKPRDDVVRSSGVERSSTETLPDDDRTLPGRDPAQPSDNTIPPRTPPVPAIP